MERQIELERGKALVLVGGSNGGEAMLARQIAGRAGVYTEMTACAMDSPHALGAMLVDEPATLIVDGFPAGIHTRRKLQSMLETETTQIEIKCQKPRIVKTPNFIFCVGSKDALNFEVDERRFLVVEL